MSRESSKRPAAEKEAKGYRKRCRIKGICLGVVFTFTTITSLLIFIGIIIKNQREYPEEEERRPGCKYIVIAEGLDANLRLGGLGG